MIQFIIVMFCCPLLPLKQVLYHLHLKQSISQNQSFITESKKDGGRKCVGRREGREPKVMSSCRVGREMGQLG